MLKTGTEADVHFLSHVLSPETPSYGGGKSFSCRPATRIAGGSTANADDWELPNHLGTHIDFPSHFFDGARSAEAYDASFWVFDHPQLIDVSAEDTHLVLPDDLSGSLRRETDILLIRTGYEKYRGEERYWATNPGLSDALGLWIRQEFPKVRVIGVDTISVTCRQKRSEGKAAHRAFLDPAGNGEPVLLLEDMHLAHAPAALRQVIVAPVRVRGTNGAPCTIFAFV